MPPAGGPVFAVAPQPPEIAQGFHRLGPDTVLVLILGDVADHVVQCGAGLFGVAGIRIVRRRFLPPLGVGEAKCHPPLFFRRNGTLIRLFVEVVRAFEGTFREIVFGAFFQRVVRVGEGRRHGYGNQANKAEDRKKTRPERTDHGTSWRQRVKRWTMLSTDPR